ncbi:uncharacterized protein RAG0_00255 [Rhynchosporium agropyri]|uniref:Uncharacterized protein n=1 Tax=Rhynchosporium agropyri TaxID=914238 RepID=A0A1E1JSA7_9HELO|nr:uncharacterized protein RAG0_00255 [Rhynchosporium agropyri]
MIGRERLNDLVWKKQHSSIVQEQLELYLGVIYLLAPSSPELAIRGKYWTLLTFCPFGLLLNLEPWTTRAPRTPPLVVIRTSHEAALHCRLHPRTGTKGSKDPISSSASLPEPLQA